MMGYCVMKLRAGYSSILWSMTLRRSFNFLCERGLRITQKTNVGRSHTWHIMEQGRDTFFQGKLFRPTDV